MKITSTLILIFLTRCQFSPLSPTFSPDATREEQVRILNQILTTPLTAADRQALKEICLVKKLLYCPALTSDPSLITLSKKYIEAPVVSGIRKAEPTPIQWTKGKIENAKKIKNEPTANLVKGLKGTSVENLKRVAQQSLKLSCPNRLAAATAALLEDSLPQTPLKKIIAQLYEKSASCRLLPTPERENFYVRAGLMRVWDKQWKASVPSFQKGYKVPNASGRAFYWYARSLRKIGKKKEAEQIEKKLSKTHPFSFHRLLVSAPEINKKDEVLGTLPSVEGLQLYLDGLTGLREQGLEKAQLIWADFAFSKLRGLNREKQLLLLEFSSPSTQIERSQYLLTGETTSHRLLKMFYPLPFKNLFTKYFSDNLYLAYAFSRQESRFFTYALSSANAMGLFQIIKETAEKLKTGSSDDLFNEEDNIEIASKYLQKLSKEWKNATPLIIASYNAGEEKVAGWVEKYPKEDAILWIDLIPYRETRDYVAQVLSHFYWYEKIYNQKNINFEEVLHL